MAYYESPRAADVLGVPETGEVSENSGWKLGARAKPARAAFARNKNLTRKQTFEESLDTFLKKARKRSIAHALYDAVMITQIIDTVIDLQTGYMRFMSVPGSNFNEEGPLENVTAFWATAAHQNECPEMNTQLVLVGSLDGLKGRSYPDEDVRYGGFSYPSDPGFMIEILKQELQLPVDLEDYEYETGWLPDSSQGQAAETAYDISQRGARAPYAFPGWVREELPAQRVVAVVNDIFNRNDHSRVVLARPVIITSTI